MKPVSDPESYGYDGWRITFKAPPGMDDCDAPVAIMEPDGTIIYIWELNTNEREALLDGAKLELRLLAGGRPPVPVSLAIRGIAERVEFA